MELRLRPLGFIEFLQNKYHKAVNKIYCFVKNSMKPWGRSQNSVEFYIYI